MLYHQSNLNDIEKGGKKEVRNVIATVKSLENRLTAREKNLKPDRNNLDNCITVHDHIYCITCKRYGMSINIILSVCYLHLHCIYPILSLCVWVCHQVSCNKIHSNLK